MEAGIDGESDGEGESAAGMGTGETPLEGEPVPFKDDDRGGRRCVSCASGGISTLGSVGMLPSELEVVELIDEIRFWE